jgi:hypothetical protein
MDYQTKLLLTSAEAIKELWGEEINETNRKRLRYFINAGFIKGYKIGDGGRWHIPRSEIDKFKGTDTDMGNRDRD